MNSEQGLVSIVLVSYNHAPYIYECLNSIKAQSYQHWELIIADDASKDASQELIQNWLREHEIEARLVFHQQNMGLCATLNECLDMVKGDSVKLFAADDIMHQDMLLKLLAELNKASDDVGMVYSNAVIINQESVVNEQKILLDPNLPSPSGWIRMALAEKNFIPSLSVLIRSSVLGKIGKFSPEILTEDYDLWLRISLNFQCYYVNEVLSYYRVHDSNISTHHDFGSDVVRLLIKNDQHGDFASRIKRLIMDRYYLNTMKPEILASYNMFQYKDKWLSFCLNKRIPYSIFRAFDKIVNLKAQA